MTTEEPVNGRATIREVYAIAERIEAKMDRRLATLEGKVDALDGKMTRVESLASLIRWLGPTGIVVALAAFLRAWGHL